MPPDARTRRGEIVALTALALLILALVITPITNNDLFLHLRTGDEILTSGAVPRVDDYSALARGRPYVAHEWLSALVFRLTERTFGERGFDALILLKAGIALLVAGCLYAAARVLGSTPPVAVTFLTLVMTLAAARFVERPHIFSYLMVAVVLLLLALRRSGRHVWLTILLPLQILWANLHGAFLLGPLIVGLAAAGEGIDGFLEGRRDGTATPERRGPRLREAARLIFLSAALVSVCLINPYGIALLRFPFELTGTSFMESIYEWQPPFQSRFAQTYMARYYVVWIVVGVGALLATVVRSLRSRRPPPFGSFPILLFATLLALSLRMNRSVTDFALATLPGVAGAASWVLPWRDAGAGRRSPLPWIAAALLGLAGWFAIAGYPYRPGSGRQTGLGLGSNIPVDAADYLETRGVRGNAFNTYAAGAYLAYRFYPDIRVGMDSRNDVYGEDLFADYSRALGAPGDLRSMLDRLDASLIFLEWPNEGMVRTARAVREIGGWQPVYFDDVAVIYLRKGGRYDHVIRRDGYSVLDPGLFTPGRLQPGNAARGLREAEQATSRHPRSYTARVMRVDALAALGRYPEAFAEERRILNERPPLHFIYTYLGLLRLALGDRSEAAARFRLALDVAPYSEAARAGLATALGP